MAPPPPDAGFATGPIAGHEQVGEREQPAQIDDEQHPDGANHPGSLAIEHPGGGQQQEREDVDVDTVVAQNPAGKLMRPQGSTVTITVSPAVKPLKPVRIAEP